MGTGRVGPWWSEIQWPDKYFSSINFVQPIRARLVVEWGVVESVRPVYDKYGSETDILIE